MWRKVTLLFVIVGLILSIAGCASQTEDPIGNETTGTQPVTTTPAVTTKAEVTTAAVTTTQQTTTAVTNPFAEKMEITWLMGAWTAAQYVEGRWDELELEEMFNIDLKMWAITFGSSYMDEVQMMLSAGDVPDYGFYYIQGDYLDQNGLGRTIPVNMIKQHYPSFYKLMVDSPVGLAGHKKNENELYGFPQYRPSQYNYEWAPMFRLDWMEDLGYSFDDKVLMDSPLNPERWNDRLYFSSTRFTVDELKEIFQALTEDDPDGNGEDDTYAYVYDTNYNSLSWIFGVSTLGANMYKDPVSGDYVPFYAYTPYRDYLKFYQEMDGKGYMRAAPSGVSILDIIQLGRTGFLCIWDPDRVLGNDGVKFPPGSIIDNADPMATFVICPPQGENGRFQRNANLAWRFYEYVVGGVSDEKLIRILSLLEYSYFGENWMRYKHGIEGVHYTWQSEPYKSPLVRTDPAKIPKKYAGTGTAPFGTFGNGDFIGDTIPFRMWTPFIIQWIAWWEKHGGFYNEDNWISPDKMYDKSTMPLEKFDQYKALSDKYNPQLNTIRNDFITRIQNGQIADINTEWEQYVRQLYAAGLEEMTAVMNSSEVKTFVHYASGGN